MASATQLDFQPVCVLIPRQAKKAESEELEIQKPQVKLRRAVSEVVRPASTPPIMASAIKDEDDEERIIAELEVFERSSVSSLPLSPRRQPIPTLLSPQDMGSPGGSALGFPRKVTGLPAPLTALSACSTTAFFPHLSR